MRKTKVVMVLESQGGTRRHVVDLIRGLDQERFDVTLIHGTSRLDASFIEDLPDLRHRARLIPCDALVRSISPLRELAALRQVRAVIREIRPDVVHCHSSKAGIIGRLAARLERTPLVFYTPHAYSFMAPEFSGGKRMVFTALERWFSRHATTLTFNVSAGEKRAALAARLDEPGKFRVIVNGIPDVPVPSRADARAALGFGGLGIPDYAPVVGVTARLVEQKDPMTFARIAAEVVRRRPDVHFVYMGDGPMESDVLAYWRGCGDAVASHTHVLGYRADAETMVAAFDVYLLTSLYEGMPYSLIESLRAGVPVAATDAVGNNEVVNPGINGSLFPVGDAEAGAAAVTALLDDPPGRDVTRETFLRRFLASQMVRDIARHYRGELLPSAAELRSEDAVKEVRR
ncbi:glycosyltransferase [Bifidobacterium sp. 82T24]|uniref:glycosyltransferase n=1 Tax=Bifidobacterium pluvialisilvae TaxID=2834436 RepID=UPI001C5854DC|nr:glycosyltransferase [Bifidobacterium pluvialisilvae]MBW3087477.1 glycosyltransferase [Bifidobacterium pluvialisilvae]